MHYELKLLEREREATERGMEKGVEKGVEKGRAATKEAYRRLYRELEKRDRTSEFIPALLDDEKMDGLMKEFKI